MSELIRKSLEDITLAPYIHKATALIDVPRKIGGNQFRHQMATLTILIDYKYSDPILLKAAVVHDLYEDKKDLIHELERIDDDGPEVAELVMELTRQHGTAKTDYLEKIKSSGTLRAKLIKLADRISNITDITTDIFENDWIVGYIKQTEEYILPMAEEVNKDMHHELTDLLISKKKLISFLYHSKRMARMFFVKNGRKKK